MFNPGWLLKPGLFMFLEILLRLLLISNIFLNKSHLTNSKPLQIKLANPSTHAIYCDVMFQEIKLTTAKRNLPRLLQWATPTQRQPCQIPLASCVTVHNSCKKTLHPPWFSQSWRPFVVFFSRNVAVGRTSKISATRFCRFLWEEMALFQQFPTIIVWSFKVFNPHLVEFDQLALKMSMKLYVKKNGTSTPLDLSNCALGFAGLEISICCTFKSSPLAALQSNRGNFEVCRNVNRLRSWISKVNPF